MATCWPFEWFSVWHFLVFAVALTVMVGFPSTGKTQEIAPFKLTEMESYLALRHFFEEDSSKRSEIKSEFNQKQRIFEEEINVLTHNYIYHPNFIKLDLGGGIIFNQERFTSQEDQRSSNDTFYNGTARLTFLEKKPYPLSLYYDRDISGISSSVAERIIRTDTTYGFDFSCKDPITPIPFDISGYRQNQEGSGFTQVIDESFDNLLIRAYKVKNKWDSSLEYEFDREISQTGDPQFPIFKTSTTTHLVTSDTTFLYGARDKLRFHELTRFFKQLEFPSTQDVLMNPMLQWRITDSLNLSSSYSLDRRQQEQLNTLTQSGNFALSHQLYESLFTDINLQGDQSRTEGLQFTRTYGGGGTITYRKKTFFGSFALNYGSNLDINDREAKAPEIPVFGERHVLTGFIPAELENDNVILSSVVVYNESRSQIYIDGFDYQLTVVGIKTRITRLVGGDIGDGETVIVDYSFATTGSFSFSDFDQNYGASLYLFSYVTLFARFRNEAMHLLSGFSTQPLNPVDSKLYGAQVYVPIGRFVIGGDSEYEEHDEVISPFRRRNFSSYVQIPLPASTIFMLSGHRVLVDNLFSPEDTNLSGGSARLDSYFWPSVRISAEASFDKDTGKTLKEESRTTRFLAEWRIRRLILHADGSYSRDTQGDLTRERIRGKVEIRREF